MKASRPIGAAAAAVAAAVALAGCSGSSSGGGGSAGPVTLTYALWDNTQQPGYQQCADQFTKQHPDIKIKITQAAWTNYWQNLTTQMTANDAPDVFTDHVAYFPQFVQDNQIVNIEPMVQTAHINLSQYQAGLANMWTKGGERFGLPKDWDTVAVVYNTKMLAAAGVSSAQLQNWTWNPVNGGTFEQIIAMLTLDKNGHNGLSPLFDKHAVKQYGIYLTYDDGGSGQNGWGNLAYENGFTFLDKNPFGTHYNYDSPALAQTISWLASLAQKGYAQSYSATSSLGPSVPLNAGQAAMTFIGDYNISSYSGPTAKQSFTYAPLPVGPDGRKTFINDLSDAIWSGTKHMQQAWQWVQFLASPACQDIVARQGIIFPAIQGASADSVQVRTAKGQDVAPFVQEANVPAGTFFYPITYDGSQIQTTVQSGLDQVWTGKASASAALASIESQVTNDMAQAGG
jgi:multiple sugar transport system substrate-binding protein